MVESGPTSAEFEPNLADFGFGPKQVNAAPIFCEAARSLPRFGRSQPPVCSRICSCAHARMPPKSCQIASKSAHIHWNSAQIWRPIPGLVWSKWVEILGREASLGHVATPSRRSATCTRTQAETWEDVKKCTFRARNYTFWGNLEFRGGTKMRELQIYRKRVVSRPKHAVF